jgi:hypothetical protein
MRQEYSEHLTDFKRERGFCLGLGFAFQEPRQCITFDPISPPKQPNWSLVFLTQRGMVGGVHL